MTKDANPNMNLLFYDFNDYGASQEGENKILGDRVPSR